MLIYIVRFDSNLFAKKYCKISKQVYIESVINRKCFDILQIRYFPVVPKKTALQLLYLNIRPNTDFLSKATPV